MILTHIGYLQGYAPCSVIGLALILVLSLATTVEAASGDSCSKATDCKDWYAPYCSTFFTDKSYQFNKM